MKELDGTYVGFILDGTDDTPDQAVMLTIGFDSIVIEMPLVDGATDVYEKAWFKDRTIPEELVFKNQDESFSLLHLRLSLVIPAHRLVEDTGSEDLRPVV